ncbi:50S ribosomal protein L6 [Nitrosomonas sp. JL21]|uniref:50S ribosomal protein L6 n=1 Tax=Nitrosomonas sp. JL21 TaxID=153949 RepID=UPI0013715F3A|nr:50S ribosomal protein L6 [Nitrosomonas sp. JL21]MBL8498287.1 50S ribosomal protein L6 [Nitrosomonas sp.]MXS77681.1 50S ribosomal protein L6 [Nitrosomonas sp. JL21]
MSRVSNNPIAIPNNVEVSLSSIEISIKGPLGILKHVLRPDITIEKHEDNTLKVNLSKFSQQGNAMAGTTRALIANMIHGVSVGFEKKLILVGVGYRAQVNSNKLNLALGFSHPVDHLIPEGIAIETPTQTEIMIKGIDKQKVGQIAAEIRAYRKPEPYKGKGIRYANEVILLKETKKK